MKVGFDKLRNTIISSVISFGLITTSNVQAAPTPSTGLEIPLSFINWSNIENTIPLYNALDADNLINVTNLDEAFAISNATLANDNNPFSSILHMSLDGDFFENPISTVDVTGTMVTATTDATSLITINNEIDAEVQFYFHPSRPLVRALYTLTDNNADSSSFEVIIGGALSSEFLTIIHNTSDGIDTIVDNDDLWMVSGTRDDDPGHGEGFIAPNTSVVTISRFATDAEVQPSNSVQLIRGDDTDLFPPGASGNFAHSYSITLDPDDPATLQKENTARILIFVELNTDITTAENCAKDFESLDNASHAQLLSGLSAIEQLEIVNYPRAADIDYNSICPHITGVGAGIINTTNGTFSATEAEETFGALSFSNLVILLGLLSLFRIDRKKR